MKAGGVHKDELSLFAIDDTPDFIPGGLWHLRHDGYFAAAETIEQGGFPRGWTAYNGDKG